MQFKNLSDYIAALEKAGELVRIKAEVDPILEVTEIADRVSKSPNNKALLFENLKGSKYPLLINSLGSTKRLAMALGVTDTKEIATRIGELIQQRSPTSFMDKLKALPALLDISKLFPKVVSTGPCKDVIKKGADINILEFPILQCWPDDGGRFITLPCVFTKDPKTGIRNCGMYRMQVYDGKTTGMHWHKHHQGAGHYYNAKQMGLDRIEVAVTLGGDPALTYSATAPMPDGMDEMMLAGFIRQKAVDMVKCETVDLEVPADVEIVLEGYVLIDEARREGPFGDHTGYYSLADDYPIFHITCITHRKNPIYPTTIVGKPPMEDTYLGVATGDIFLPMLKKMVPEIVDMSMPMEGVFHNIMFIAIDKRYPKQAQKIMNYVWGMGQMMFTKMIVVVDKDVDVQNTSDVLFRMGNNVDWKRDIIVTEGPVDALDHASSMPLWGGKIGIDATRKLPEEGYTREWPGDIVMSDDVKAAVTKRWKEYGISI